ncbi:MerR family transcriptional regulator [bacterium]|nr:MerR family transcriptional regulator [bacterium]
MTYTVKAVAELSGVSTRALHHYDEIGLLKPASVSPAGYRHYGDDELERLQQILFFRELGFSLQEIKQIIDRPDFDRKQALLTHKQLLIEKQRRLHALIQSVDESIGALESGKQMKNDAMFEAFNDSKLVEYREEAKARWGQSNAWKESEERSAKYTKGDWLDIKTELQAISENLASLMDRDPADPIVQEGVGRWWQMINERFYSLTPEIFRGLGDMYVADPRFTETYDKVKPGLAAFMQRAMHVYADAQEAKRS